MSCQPAGADDGEGFIFLGASILSSDGSGVTMVVLACRLEDRILLVLLVGVPRRIVVAAVVEEGLLVFRVATGMIKRLVADKGRKAQTGGEEVSREEEYKRRDKALCLVIVASFCDE